MKLRTMLRDILRALLSKPATERYPFERPETAERFRGKLHWTPEGCTGCCLCMKDCPADAIEVITLDKKAKKFLLRYYPERCVYCGQCVESCRFGCLEMANDDWEMATDADPVTLEITYGDDADVERFLAEQAGEVTEGE